MALASKDYAPLEYSEVATEESCEVKTQRAILCSEMPTFILLRVSHLYIISPARSPADFNLAGPPHVFVLCTAHVHMVRAKYKCCLAGSFFSSSFVSENVVKKMCNVCPLQNERLSGSGIILTTSHDILRIVSVCGRHGSSDCPLLCPIILGC